MDINVEYNPNEKQYIFHSSNSDEVVYGGAKGGGKSCALVMEALAYALEYPGANMYIFRETYDDLEANIIKEWKDKVPNELYKYNESKHQATLINGSSVKFRYIRSYADAEGYQGRSMDWVGVDELTKHEKRSIQELLSCLRSPKGFPPRFRGTCNPGGIGHAWVKESYIEGTNYGENIINDPITNNTMEFIPAKVYDNVVLMQNDPNYVKRLENLPEDKKKAFLYGDWDIFEGQHFSEFDREVHVIEPFIIPEGWYRYTASDYGLDMEATLWFAVDYEGTSYCYKESYKPNLIISEACSELIRVNNGDELQYRYGPPDLMGRNNTTGETTWELFSKHGWNLYKSDNRRDVGALAMKEFLKVYTTRDIATGEEVKTSKLKFFKTCHNIIRTLPQLQTDDKDPNKYATEPHELTHAPDALRYYCVMRNIKPEEDNRPKVIEEDYQADSMMNWNNVY